MLTRIKKNTPISYVGPSPYPEITTAFSTWEQARRNNRLYILVLTADSFPIAGACFFWSLLRSFLSSRFEKQLLTLEKKSYTSTLPGAFGGFCLFRSLSPSLILLAWLLGVQSSPGSTPVIRVAACNPACSRRPAGDNRRVKSHAN